jgi:hypothetical protein
VRAALSGVSQAEFITDSTHSPVSNAQVAKSRFVAKCQKTVANGRDPQQPSNGQ